MSGREPHLQQHFPNYAQSLHAAKNFIAAAAAAAPSSRNSIFQAAAAAAPAITQPQLSRGWLKASEFQPAAAAATAASLSVKERLACRPNYSPYARVIIVSPVYIYIQQPWCRRGSCLTQAPTRYELFIYTSTNSLPDVVLYHIAACITPPRGTR